MLVFVNRYLNKNVLLRKGWDIFKILLLLFHTVCTKMKFHTRTILYKGTVKLFYIDYLILGIRENFFKKIQFNKVKM